MTELEMLAKRLNDVESHLAHQQETIRELSDVSAAQWKMIDTLQRRVADLADRLQVAQSGVAAAADEKPPPHY